MGDILETCYLAQRRGSALDICIEGLEVYGHHGVVPEERVLGQRFYFDVRLTVADCPAALSDRVEEAVDYTEVMDLIVEIATTDSYLLLERLVRVVAEAILQRFPVDGVWLRVSKPHPPVACALSGVSVSLELCRSDLEG